MFLSSQHQTSVVETEDATQAFDLLDHFLWVCCCLASLVPVTNLWSRYGISAVAWLASTEDNYIPWHRHMQCLSKYARLMISFLEFSDTRTNYNMPKTYQIVQENTKLMEKRWQTLIKEAWQGYACWCTTNHNVVSITNSCIYTLNCSKFLQHQHR